MKAVLIIWDGLRPEFVDPGVTPALCALSDQGTTFSNHTAIFPTETRVNSSSIATGMYPDKHGIVANRFLDRRSNRMVNSGDHADLGRLLEDSGAILPVPTLCGRLRKQGYKSLVVGSGSPGSTLLQDPSGQDRFVNVRGLIRPESDLEPFVAEYGAFPEESYPPDPWNDLACKVFADGLRSGDFDFGVLWLCDPDFTQHKYGLGSPESLSAIRMNDGRLAKLRRDLPDGIDLLVVSDHGFSTVDQDSRQDPEWLGLSRDAYKVGSSGIYLQDPEHDLESVASSLLKQDWVGPVFLREERDETLGIIAGTFGQSLVRLNHPDRSPDIVYSRRWTGEANANSVDGIIHGAGGIATHGSLSPSDRKCVLIAAGPSFKDGLVSPIQSAAVDIAPTVLRLFDQKAELDGRVLREGLRNGPAPSDVAVRQTIVREVEGVVISFVEIDGKRYLGEVEI